MLINTDAEGKTNMNVLFDSHLKLYGIEGFNFVSKLIDVVQKPVEEVKTEDKPSTKVPSKKIAKKKPSKKVENK